MYGIKQKKGKRNEKSEGNQEKRSRILPETSCTADPDGCTESDECTGKCVRCVNGRYAGPEFPVCSFACHTDFFCPESLYAAITIGTTVMVVYFLLNLDEMIKLPAVYRHYKKYQWVNNITREDTE